MRRIKNIKLPVYSTKDKKRYIKIVDTFKEAGLNNIEIVELLFPLKIFKNKMSASSSLMCRYRRFKEIIECAEESDVFSNFVKDRSKIPINQVAIRGVF